MVGIIIVFNDAVSEEKEMQIEFTPVEEGYEINLFDTAGDSLLKQSVVIPKKNLHELKRELLHIL